AVAAWKWGRQAVPRERRRRCRDLRASRPVRCLAAAPADVPHRGRTRGVAAWSDRRARVACAQQRAARPGPARAAATRRPVGRAEHASVLARPARLGRAMIDLRSKIREVPDFPTPGVGFKDVTPMLADPESLQQTVSELAT